MIRINLVEDSVSIMREPATPKEVFEASLIMFIGAAMFSAIVLLVLNCLALVLTD